MSKAIQAKMLFDVDQLPDNSAFRQANTKMQKEQ